MRVFEVKPPAQAFFCNEHPTHAQLDQIVLSSHAFVKETNSASYAEFVTFCKKYLTRVSTSYIGTLSAETTFYKRVRIQKEIYMKVPLFFPYFCHFKATTVIDKRRTPSYKPDRFHVRKGFELYDYQERVRDLILPQLKSKPYHSSIMHAVCGAGKTGMTCYLIAQLGVPVIIFVNTDHLMNQWVGELKAWLGLDEVDDIGFISGKHKSPEKPYPVLLCMLQSIRKGSKGYSVIQKQIQHYDLLVSDECHHMAADTYYETMSLFKGRHRLALSATLERSDDMIRLVPYLFGPVGCCVVEDLLKSTYVKYYHPIHYSNPAHANKLYLPQWRPEAQPKLNYGGMLSRMGDDLARIRLTIQYTLQSFPGQRVLFLSKLRCQAIYTATYLQFREFVPKLFFLLVENMHIKFCNRETWWTLAKMSHAISDVEHETAVRIKERARKKKNKKRKSMTCNTDYKNKNTADTSVFLYMGGGASSKKKRSYRDKMLESAQYLCCTAAIAGEAFSIRGVHVLCILTPQKPNGSLEQFEGRVKRGKDVDQVDVVSLIDSDNPTFANTGRSQTKWFREQRYLILKPHKLSVDMKTCPKPSFVVDSRSQKLAHQWKIEKKRDTAVRSQKSLLEYLK